MKDIRQKATAFFLEDNYEKAGEIYQELVEKYPTDNPLVYKNLARCMSETNQFQKASKFYTKAE